jgi:hypothetical protein
VKPAVRPAGSRAGSPRPLARVLAATALALAALFSLLAPTLQARAAEQSASIGIVKTVRGEAWVIAAGMPTAASPGARLTQGSIVRTGAAGAIGMTLKDGTILALGPESELLLDDFQFAPASGALSLAIALVRGTLEFVSGAIARLRPEAVRIQTPSATLGVRGTRFLVKVEQ